MNQSNITAMTNNSNTPDESCKYWEPDWWDMTITAKMILVMLFGGIGLLNNVFVTVIAAKYTQRRNLHHLIVNMAVSDSLLVLCLVAYYTASYFKYVFNIEPFLTILFCFYTFQCTSLVSLLMITIKRFQVTGRDRVHRPQPITLKQRVAVLGCTWLISMALAALYIISVPQSVAMTTKIAVYSTGTTIVAICYCMIVVLNIVILKRLSHPPDIQANLPDRQRELRKKWVVSAVRMVLFSLLLYSCCCLPGFLILNLLDFFDVNCYPHVALVSFVVNHSLPLLNSCLSPYIYIYFLADFRHAARKILCGTATNQVEGA